jgi:hypothetical protein
MTMTKICRLTAVLSITALALFAAVSAGAANPHPTYTCTKVKHNGDTDTQVNVPESAVSGLTNAGFTCAPNDDENQGNENQGNENQGNENQGNENQGNENQGNENQGNENQGASAPTPGSWVSQEPRSLYCLLAGKTPPAEWNGMGPALNLFDSQGELLVQMGVATPARFYQGLGASCDVLPGYTYAGAWVDHVGIVVPGVAVYPFYVAG